MKLNWNKELYCGIALEWHCCKGYVDISIPNYVHKSITKYLSQHQECMVKKQIRCKKETKAHQQQIRRNNILQVLDGFFGCARTVDMTILKAPNIIMQKQTNHMKRTLVRVGQFSDCLYTNPTANIHVYLSYDILNMLSDAYFQIESRTRSQSGGYFLSRKCQKTEKQLNQPIMCVYCLLYLNLLLCQLQKHTFVQSFSIHKNHA